MRTTIALAAVTLAVLIAGLIKAGIESPIASKYEILWPVRPFQARTTF